jgi:hypothetical protein
LPVIWHARFRASARGARCCEEPSAPRRRARRLCAARDDAGGERRSARVL